MPGYAPDHCSISLSSHTQCFCPLFPYTPARYLCLPHTPVTANTAHPNTPKYSSHTCTLCLLTHQPPKFSTSSPLHLRPWSQDRPHPCLLYHMLCFPVYGCPHQRCPAPAYSFGLDGTCRMSASASFHPPTSRNLCVALPPLWNFPSSCYGQHLLRTSFLE